MQPGRFVERPVLFSWILGEDGAASREVLLAPAGLCMAPGRGPKPWCSLAASQGMGDAWPLLHALCQCVVLGKEQPHCCRRDPPGVWGPCPISVHINGGLALVTPLPSPPAPHLKCFWRHILPHLSSAGRCCVQGTLRQPWVPCLCPKEVAKSWGPRGCDIGVSRELHRGFLMDKRHLWDLWDAGHQ